MHNAADNGLSDVLIKALEIDSDLAKVQDKFGETFLHNAADNGLSDVLIKALEINPTLAKVQSDDCGFTFLHKVPLKALPDVLIKALEVDPNLLLIKDNNGKTVLDLVEKEANNKNCPAGFQKRVKFIKNELTKTQGNTSAKELLSARKNKERI